jgi:hypothetical protein
MALWTERKQAIRIAIGQLMEDIFAFKDIEPLAFKQFDDDVPNFTERLVRVIFFAGNLNHSPEQHPRQIISVWSAVQPGLFAHSLLSDHLLGIPLSLGFSGHKITPCWWSLSLTVGYASDKHRLPKIIPKLLSSSVLPANGICRRIANPEFGNEDVEIGIAAG